MTLELFAVEGPDLPSNAVVRDFSGQPTYTDGNPKEVPLRFIWKNNGPGTAAPGQLFRVHLKYSRKRLPDGRTRKQEAFNGEGAVQGNPRFTPANQTESNTFEVVSSSAQSIEFRNLVPLAPGQTAQTTITWARLYINGDKTRHTQPFFGDTEVLVGPAGPKSNAHTREHSKFWIDHDPELFPAHVSIHGISSTLPRESGHYGENNITRDYDSGVVRTVTTEVRWQNDGPEVIIPGHRVLVQRGEGQYRATPDANPVASNVVTLRNPRSLDLPNGGVAAWAVVESSRTHLVLEARRLIRNGQQIPALIEWTVDPIPADQPAGIYSHEITIGAADMSPTVVNESPNQGNYTFTPATFRKL